MIGENLTFSPQLCNIAVGSWLGQITVLAILIEILFYGFCFYVTKRVFDIIFDIIMFKIKEKRKK